MLTRALLRTEAGAWLAVDAAGRIIVTRDLTAHRMLLIVRPGHAPTFGFTFTASGTPIAIEGCPCVEAVQPWRVTQRDGGFALSEPAYGHVLVVDPDGRASVQGRREDFQGTLVSIVSMRESAVTFFASETTALIETLAPRNLNGPDLLDLIHRALTPRTAAVMQAILRLAPRDQLGWLGGTLLGLPEHLAKFATAFPDDLWSSRALPDLREWVATRQGASQISLPVEWEFLGRKGLDGRQTSIGHTLNAIARAGIPPRRTCCVVATARNEGLYLIEWVAYHRAIGADAIFIYSNDNSDGSDDVLQALANAGEIVWIDNRMQVGGRAQPKAYGHAFGVLPQVLDYRWSLVIDLDEFFAFDTARFRSLPDFIAWQETQHVDAIALNWLVFGSSGETHWSGRPLTERFTQRLPWIDQHIKSLSRTNLCVHSHPHHASFDWLRPIVTCDASGDVHRTRDGASFSETPRADRAWIAHYFLKSAEEFVWKFSRNRGDHAVVRQPNAALISQEFAAMFVDQHNSPTMVEDQRTGACAPNLADEIRRLLALPAVAAAQARAVDAYRTALPALLQQLRSDVRSCKPASAQLRLLTLLDRT